MMAALERFSLSCNWNVGSASELLRAAGRQSTFTESDDGDVSCGG